MLEGEEVKVENFHRLSNLDLFWSSSRQIERAPPLLLQFSNTIQSPDRKCKYQESKVEVPVQHKRELKVGDM